MAIKDTLNALARKALCYISDGSGNWSEWDGKVTLNSGDFEVGGVEIKNSTDDTRATVNASHELLVKDTTADGYLATIDADTSAMAADTAALVVDAAAIEVLLTTLNGLVDGVETLLGTIDADTSALALGTVYKVQAPVKATGNAAIAWTDALAPAFDFNLIGMTVHLSAAGGAGSTNFTITQDGVTAGDDVVHLSRDMTAEADIDFFPAVPIPFVQGDALDIAYSNALGRTYWITLWYSRRY